MTPVSDQNADGDHELVEGDEAATDVRRRHLGDVEGNHDRGHPHGEAEYHAAHDQNRNTWGKGGHEGSDGEDDRRYEDNHPPAISVGEGAARHRADQERTDDHALQERRDLEVLFDEQESPGNYSRIVAE